VGCSGKSTINAKGTEADKEGGVPGMLQQRKITGLV
jgi:hypothetical protein